MNGKIIASFSFLVIIMIGIMIIINKFISIKNDIAPILFIIIFALMLIVFGFLCIKLKK